MEMDPTKSEAADAISRIMTQSNGTVTSESTLKKGDGPQHPTSSSINPSTVSSSSSAKSASASASAAFSDVAVVASKVVPKAPQSAYELERALGDLKDDASLLGQYLTQIAPDALPSLLGESLSEEILVRCATGIATMNQKQSWDFLQALSRARRFSTATMFLDGHGKKMVEAVFSHISKDLPSGVTVEAVKALRKKYI